MDIQQLQAQNRFHIHQKIKMMVNQYQVFTDNNGEPGELVAFVQQKRMKFKEEVTLYTDDAKDRRFASFKARKVIDLASGYDVWAGDGRPVGVFGKKFGKSLLRSTWQLDQPGHETVEITERSMGMALFRRIWTFLPWIGDLPFPWKYHFDFVSGSTSVCSFEKKTRFRDHYLVQISDDSLDRVLVLAQSIALDALQSR